MAFLGTEKETSDSSPGDLQEYGTGDTGLALNRFQLQTWIASIPNINVTGVFKVS